MEYNVRFIISLLRYDGSLKLYLAIRWRLQIHGNIYWFIIQYDVLVYDEVDKTHRVPLAPVMIGKCFYDCV